MNIKKELGGCWLAVSTVIIIILIGGLLLFAVGTMGDILFDVVTVLQNHMGKLLLSAGALGIVIWFIKNWCKEKGEDF
jgi:hypothetical protein